MQKGTINYVDCFGVNMLQFHKIDVFIHNEFKNQPLYFLGSTLRGAFGVALKKVVCINPSFECEGCFAANNCLFYEFFEKKNRAHTYRFSVALGSENYDFSLYLFGSAAAKLPYVLSALHKMFYEVGVGVNREKINIEKITCNETIVYENSKFQIENIQTNCIDLDGYRPGLKLTLVTPLRMKSENKLERHSVTLVQILQSIQNRYYELLGKDIAKLAFEPQFNLIKSDMHFLDLSRYSNKQKTKMKIGGLVGDLIIDGLDMQSFELLKIGEIIGAGKQTVFGLGEIKIN